jgi:adenylosuccinate lyase
MTRIVAGLVVFPAHMRRNLDRARGMVFSQNVLLALTEAGCSREDAYRWVQRAAMRVWDENVEFRAALGADPDVGRHLDAATLDRCFDLDHQLRHVPQLFARTLES